jgi:hypothetical protein
VCLLGVAPLFAAKRAQIASELGRPGAVILQDDFERSDRGDAWQVAKGDWTIVEGSLVGKELPADKHAAVGSIGGTHRDSIVRFSFQFNGAKQFSFSLNKAKGHLARLNVNEQGLTLLMDKDKADPQSKAEVLAKAQGVIEPNHWHTLQVEIVGDRITARTDSGLKVSGQHPDLACEKPGYRFVVSGESLRIDDLTVSAVQ